MTAPALFAVEFFGLSLPSLVASVIISAVMLTLWNWRLLVRMERVEDDRDDMHKDRDELHKQIAGVINTAVLHESKDEAQFKELTDKVDDVQETMTTLVAEVKGLGESMEAVDRRITAHDERNFNQSEDTRGDLKQLSREVSRIQGATGIEPTPKKHKRPPKKSPPK